MAIESTSSSLLLSAPINCQPPPPERLGRIIINNPTKIMPIGHIYGPRLNEIHPILLVRNKKPIQINIMDLRSRYFLFTPIATPIIISTIGQENIQAGTKNPILRKSIATPPHKINMPTHIPLDLLGYCGLSMFSIQLNFNKCIDFYMALLSCLFNLYFTHPLC